MAIELKVPRVGESINEVEIGEWLKKEGDSVAADETIVMLDSAKTTVELPAPSAGVLGKIVKQTGETAQVGETIALLEEAGTSAGAASEKATAQNGATQPPAQTVALQAETSTQQPAKEDDQGDQHAQQPHDSKENPAIAAQEQPEQEARVMPAAQRLLAEQNLSPQDVQASGPGGRVLKEDVMRHAADTAQNGQAQAPTKEGTVEPSQIERTAPAQPDGKAPQETRQPAPVAKAAAAPAPQPSTQQAASTPSNDEEVVPMSMLRRHVAQRLVEAQQNAALLTTFNEIDMTNVMQMRKDYQDAFTKKYGIKLGFMSFFVKAVIDALKQTPGINAEIRGRDIVYKNYYDIGVAIGSGKGLVVPVIRRAERLSFAEVEKAIAEFAGRAKENKLSPDELQGGTFTITNGGIYGSLMSTPIINPPQSGILGMHSIQERPIARSGQVVIAPMMYVALTYDHRVVDGREAVTFLVRIKDCIENPARMLIEV
ncbi:MAG TPA: 2-oxoglutarate dehydrogenase complex dihydrolipoyllysine-residue succinyltransferase [Abditibacteriaceae bacterium]|jgi:2-oxoglutarate dehydrogenase E2 component (dihydrolipoamide succinyltransferase)